MLSWVWLRESISALECYAIFGSYGGILIMSLAKPSGDGVEANDKYKYTLGILLSVVCSASMAVTAVSTRKLRTVHHAVISYWTAVVTTAVCAVLVGAQCLTERRVPYVFSSPAWWWLLLGASCVYIYSQLLMIYCNQVANPALVGLLQYCGVVYNWMADVFVFHNTFTPMQLTGVGIVMAINIGTSYTKVAAILRDTPPK